MTISIALPRQAILEEATASDASLLEAARTMNKDALVKIFDRYSPALYNYAFRLCNDAITADNIVGDVFATLLDQFSAGNGPTTNLRSYLYEMAYHLIVDESRFSNRVAPLEVVDLLQYDGYAAAVSLENQVLIQTVMVAIRKHLTKDQRHVIILRFLEGFSLIETATIIGKEVTHVKVIQNRAIAALRRTLDAQITK
jgi:RNA polymerase sigma-70 factor (ECF subfamily)